jgi:phosphoribosylaminoimidazolecarboxamide formyltransferase/IMP cyclohydrolase
MPDRVPIRRALISVSDKTDLLPFARALASRGVEIISTGGTAKALGDAGVPVTHIEKVTGFPEIMGGRVKTLHPSVHGALLALRDNPDHMGAAAQHGITPIDLVCINLYPFERALAAPNMPEHEAVEQIDIGGPSMIRSAAKNFEWVTVVTAPRQYDRVVSDMETGGGATCRLLRADLAVAAFGRTSEYDAAIASYLGRRSSSPFPQVLRLGYIKVDDVRYGENPHQEAALFRDPGSTGPTIVNARKLHGKELSYNNINDASAALELVKALRRIDPDSAGACIVKHTNPCGAAIGRTAVDAIDAAVRGDPLAAFGGILAVNTRFDAAAAERVCRPDMFLEVVVAPDFEDLAADMLGKRWANVRLLAVGSHPGSASRKLEYRSIPGGMLVQDRDNRVSDPTLWKHAAGPAPTPDVIARAQFGEAVARALSSNAIAIVGADEGKAIRLFGAGAGQMDRVTACRLAVEKAAAGARGALASSDAFFPFPDGPQVLIEAGVKALVHPGGSKRDQETFDLCNQRGVTCLVTGVRHFRH